MSLGDRPIIHSLVIIITRQDDIPSSVVFDLHFVIVVVGVVLFLGWCFFFWFRPETESEHTPITETGTSWAFIQYAFLPSDLPLASFRITDFHLFYDERHPPLGRVLLVA
jgi:hypothetical protein